VEKEITEERVVAAGIPKSWACIDCGVNTAPGCMNAGHVQQMLNPTVTGGICARK